MICHLLRSSVALQVLIGLGSSVLAGEAPSSLPVLALAPPAPPETLSRWSGFYAGSEIFAISGSGALRGGVGGAVDFGYNHEFSNNVVVGVGAAVGYAPALLRNSPYAGFDLAMTSLKVGYDMGRLMPYVTTGIILEKPHTGLAAGYTGASDAVNGLFTGSSNLRAAGAVGVGFDYAVTDKLSVGMDVGVAAGRNPGPFGPGALGR
jgi:outer membrane immunogenic protein